jgi:hypothetical protein
MKPWLRLLTAAMTLMLATGASASGTAQDGPALLARARAAYNERNFDEAIVTAREARNVAEVADEAAIVMARAHLERYRERADPADLSAARDALGLVRPAGLDSRDHVELLLAFGEALFLQDDFGAAAEVLESGIDRAVEIDPILADAVLDWWGSAVERQASALPTNARKALFARLAERMRQELARLPQSPAASYWTVVGLRGAGEPDRAWDAAVAAWVRARLTGERAPGLRADLDRLVTHGIIPDRVRFVAPDERARAESQLKADWELIKERWR